MEYNIVVQLVLLAVHFAISFFVVWLVYRLFKKLFGLLRNPISGTNTSVLNLFLSFGITSLFFQGVVHKTIFNFWRFLIAPFENAQIIKTYVKDGAFMDESQEIDFANFVFDWSQRLGESFVQHIVYLDYTGMILFLTFWLLISLIFREIDQSIREAESSAASGKFKNLAGNSTVKNIFTILVLTFSIYLSISSIVAVPEFQNLEATSSVSEINKEFSEELENQKIYTSDNLIIETDSILDADPGLFEVDITLRRLRNSVEDYNTWVNMNWTRDEKAKKIAIQRLKAAVDQKIGVKERIKYKLDLTEWYLSSHSNWTSIASLYQSKLVLATESMREILSDKGNLRLDTIYDSRDSLRFDVSLNRATSSGLERIQQDLRGFTSQIYAVNANYNIGLIPDKPSIGEKFGIFNTISGWLLKTESLSLALIVGLFGFGLLGSIGSTFIRRRLKKTPEDQADDAIVVYDLQGILINGISAAIVVFLAVKGAIVIFSTNGDDNLNPYVLFFTCLVASVFSEDVWSWARKKLNQNLGETATAPKGTKVVKKGAAQSAGQNKGTAQKSTSRTKGSGPAKTNKTNEGDGIENDKKDE
ncbi:MAG: hypothetical protein AAGB24_14380 [Bacteroidota bacterium]